MLHISVSCHILLYVWWHMCHDSYSWTDDGLNNITNEGVYLLDWLCSLHTCTIHACMWQIITLFSYKYLYDIRWLKINIFPQVRSSHPFRQRWLSKRAGPCFSLDLASRRPEIIRHIRPQDQRLFDGLQFPRLNLALRDFWRLTKDCLPATPNSKRSSGRTWTFEPLLLQQAFPFLRMLDSSQPRVLRSRSSAHPSRTPASLVTWSNRISPSSSDSTWRTAHLWGCWRSRRRCARDQN